MSILRDCPIRLAAALASHTKMFRANLYQITLIDGTIYRWTDWERTLTASSHIWTAMKLKRGKWNLTNTMTVPSMDFTVLSAGEAFEGGANIKAQAHNGLFDGADIVHSRAYMIAPDDTTALGVIALNAWIVGEINIGGGAVAMTLKGRNNRLNQQAPRNLYQASCLHTFCDAGCGLVRANFTTTHTVGTAATTTRTFIPWDTAPSDYALYQTGTVEFLSGVHRASRRRLRPQMPPG